MGIEEVLQLEIHRARWRREREACSLASPVDQEFALGRLPLPGVYPLVRLLIVPADPEADILAFDYSFWGWFTGDLPDPATGRTAEWGSRNRPTSRTALRYPPYATDKCRRYLAVHRSGALEMGLGHDVGYVAEPTDMTSGLQAAGRGGESFLWLTTMVGGIWAAAGAYAELLERWPVEGPFQAVLGVRLTQGMVLGDFGTGWAEPHSMLPEERSVCLEPGLLRLWELAFWPDQDGIRSFAFEVGSWLEDAFGSRHRRYLARQGPFEGRFDSGRYAW